MQHHVRPDLRHNLICQPLPKALKEKLLRSIEATSLSNIEKTFLGNKKIEKERVKK